MKITKTIILKNMTPAKYKAKDLKGRWVFGTPIETKPSLKFGFHNAKDGDVLYSLDSKRPFIYKERKPHEQATAYCGINIYGKFFVWKTKDCIIITDKYIPATKEQRDFLFSNMKEEGYEWDADNKKLKKIDNTAS